MKKNIVTFSDDTGDAIISVYNVFPGVELAYYSIHMDSLKLDIPTARRGKRIEIHHCQEGRIEQQFGEEFFYLMPGDLSVALRTEMAKAYCFPLRHYHGIGIGLDLNAFSDEFCMIMNDLGLQLEKLLHQLRTDENCLIMRSEKFIEHVFSELYTVPESIQEGYLKVKVLELLLVLSDVDMYRSQPAINSLPLTYVRLANRIAAYLAEHMGQHITIPELARSFGISATHLKTVFRGVYGMPVFSYMRTQRMQAAAQLLIHTEAPIAAIAEEFGYANASKFSSAFQAIMGETPREFRKAHSKCHIR